jgi:hypothetical protein
MSTESPLEPKGRQYGTPGMIFLCHRGSKQDEKPLARSVLDSPFILAYFRQYQGIQGLHQAVQCVEPHPFEQVCDVGDGAIQHGHELALSRRNKRG